MHAAAPRDALTTSNFFKTWKSANAADIGRLERRIPALIILAIIPQ
jgi:hypothetical protein